MCGIAGIIKRELTPSSSTGPIENMLSTMEHTGPDGWGTYASDGIALGHVRLSIVDLAGGSQPMQTERYVISFNGEI